MSKSSYRPAMLRRQPSVFPEKCTIQRSNGSFCDAPAAAGAPHSVCPRHMLRIYKFAQQTLDEHRSQLMEQLQTIDRSPTVPLAEVVYYLHVGSYIKIGTTRDLRVRIRSYPPDTRLLATESGGVDIERDRLREFADLLYAPREWFLPGPSLVAHIAALDARQSRAA